MKYSLGISSFFEEISSLSHSIVFLYFFALITEEGFLLSPWFLWNSAFICLYLSFSPLLFTSLLFTAICKASWYSHFAFLHFFFLEMVLIPVSCTMSQTSIHSSLGTLSIRSNPLNLFVTSNYMDCRVHGVTKSRTRLSDFHFTSELCNCKEFDLGHTWIV